MTQESTQSVQSWSPQQPDDLVDEADGLDGKAVAELLTRSRGAQTSWWRSGAPQRAAALGAAADELQSRAEEAVALVVREVGKPVAEALGEVSRAVSILRYYAQAAFQSIGELFPCPSPGLLYVERRPVGVAGLITPWNFPIAIPLWKAAPALTTGNGVLLKPSPDALGCARLVVDVLARHLPHDLVALVPGNAQTGEAIVEAVDIVSFTGSEAVGHEVAIAAARRGVAVQCEMGGQNAAVVLPDANPAETAELIAGAAMGYAGQKCTATRRVIIVGQHPQFRDALIERVRALRPTDPGERAAVVGPVISESARARVLDAVGDADAAGAHLLVGGHVLDSEGWYVEPTLVEGVPVDHPLSSTEVFGPFTLIQTVGSLEEALSLNAAVPFGLVTSIHGHDIDTILDAVSRADTGMVKVNAPTTGVDFYAPFGGEKASSYGGREQGPAALEFYTSSRTVTVAAHAG